MTIQQNNYFDMYDRWDVCIIISVVIYVVLAGSNVVLEFYDHSLNKLIMCGLAAFGAFCIEISYIFCKTIKPRYERISVYGCLFLIMLMLVVGSMFDV